MGDQYKILSESNGIVMKQKIGTNEYKIVMVSSLKSVDRAIDVFKKNKFFDLLHLLNKDIIDTYKSTDSGVLVVLSIVDDEDDIYGEFDKYFINFKPETVCVSDNFSKGKIMFNIRTSIIDTTHDDDVQINLENFDVGVGIDRDEQTIKIIAKFTFVDKKVLTHVKNVMGLFLNKAIGRLKKYFQEN